jgi:hypothetical protein
MKHVLDEANSMENFFWLSVLNVMLIFMYLNKTIKDTIVQSLILVGVIVYYIFFKYTISGMPIIAHSIIHMEKLSGGISFKTVIPIIYSFGISILIMTSGTILFERNIFTQLDKIYYMFIGFAIFLAGMIYSAILIKKDSYQKSEISERNLQEMISKIEK